jgi:hypothetical protein
VHFIADGHLVRSCARRGMALCPLTICIFFLEGASFTSDAILQHPDVFGNAVAFSIPLIGIISPPSTFSEAKPQTLMNQLRQRLVGAMSDKK